MHIRNTHVQKFTQNTFFRPFFYANYPQCVNFSTREKNRQQGLYANKSTNFRKKREKTRAHLHICKIFCTFAADLDCTSMCVRVVN